MRMWESQSILLDCLDISISRRIEISRYLDISQNWDIAVLRWTPSRFPRNVSRIVARKRVSDYC